MVEGILSQEEETLCERIWCSRHQKKFSKANSEWSCASQIPMMKAMVGVLAIPIFLVVIDVTMKTRRLINKLTLGARCL